MAGNVIWAQADLQFIRQNCHFMSDQQIAEVLTRLNNKPILYSSVRDCRHKIGIKKTGNGKVKTTTGLLQPRQHRRVYARQEAYRAECLFWIVIGVLILTDVLLMHLTGRSYLHGISDTCRCHR